LHHQNFSDSLYRFETAQGSITEAAALKITFRYSVAEGYLARVSKENDHGFYRNRQLRRNFSHRHHLGHKPSRRRAPTLS
jgi:hypothetical protein